MRTAVIYARFSSDKQNEDSIEAQVRACREYAAQHDILVLSVYADEAISGCGAKTQSRQQYQKMLQAAQKQSFDVILIHKYDRIARDLEEHVNLEAKLAKWNIRLIAAGQDFGTSNESKIMRALTWSMSEYYLDNLSAETRKGLKEIALRGEHTGGVPPFGYDVVDKHLVINELEASYVRKIFDAASSRVGYNQVIEEMAQAGIVGKRGKPIGRSQITEILHNEKYTGVYLYCPVEEKNRNDRRAKPNAIRIEDAIPAIVAKEQFQEVQKIMQGRKQTGNKRNYLCSGLVYCPCGAKMHALHTTRKGHDYFYYTCSQKCGSYNIRMDDVDDAARAYLKELLSDKNQLLIEDALRAYIKNSSNRQSDFETAVKQKIAAKQKEYDALLHNLSSAALPATVVADIGKKMEKLQSEIEVLNAAEPPKDFTAETVRGWLQSIRTAPDTKAVHLLIERIEVIQGEDKTKTAFNIHSTLKAVLGKCGCGSGT